MFDLNGPRTLRCILAVALYVSWTTLLVWDTPLVVEGVLSWEPEWFMFLLKGAFLLGTALSLVFRYCMRASRFQRVGSKPLSVLMVVTPALPGFASILECCGLSSPGGLLFAFWFLAGFGSAHLLMQANRSMLVLGTEICRAIMFISTFIAFSIGLLISSAAVSSPMFASASMIVLPWLCFAFSHFVHSENVLEERDELYSYDIEDRAIEDKQLRHSFGRFELQLLLYSAIFSYSLFSICFGNFENMHGKIWAGVFFAGLLIMVYVTWLNQHVRIENLQWTLLLVVAIVLPLTSLSASIRQLVPVCCATLMFSFTTYDLLSISQLESFILLNKLSYIRYFSIGRLSNSAGIFIGWLLAAVTVGIASSTGDGILMQVFPIGLLVVFMFFLVFFSFDNFKASIRTANAEVKQEATVSWKGSCDEISAECKLSAREHEVFVLLAKGRDSVFISEALYISIHTVRSHIYHVYQKLGTHSQQELITLVEERAGLKSDDGR